jgi:hypothetical protein
VATEYVCGIDLGQMADHSAMAVLRREERYPPGTLSFDQGVTRKEAHYAVVHLVRWKLSTAYTTIVEDIKKLVARPPLPGCKLVVDAGGVGRAVLDLLKTAVREGMKASLVPVTLTGGNKPHATPAGWTVPKHELAGVLQVLLQNERLKIADLPERSQLLREFRNFSMRLNPKTGHASYEALSEAVHDDIVCAVALGCWLAEKGSRPAGSLKVINLRPRGSHVLSEKELRGKLRVVCCTNEQLPTLEIEDHTTGLVVITEPPADGEKADESEPVHGLLKNVGTIRLSFTDHQPAEHEATWNDPIPPWDKPVSQLMMDVMQGKRLWAFLRDQRRTVPEVVVIAAPSMDTALSVGYALCDQLHCDRLGTLYVLNMDPDEEFKGDAPNLHIYARVRETRSMVC